MKGYNEYANRQTWMVAVHLSEMDYFTLIPREISHQELSKKIQTDITEYCNKGLESDLQKNMIACFINHIDFYQLADTHINN